MINWTYLQTIRRLITAVLLSLISFSSVSKTLAFENGTPTQNQIDIVLVRGGFDIFSQGLDKISTELKSRGIASRVYGHRETNKIVESILQHQQSNGRRPIVLIGHSWGANAIISIATILKDYQIAVRYMATFAATNPPAAPSNIEELTNYYFKKDGWGKPIRKSANFSGRLENIDMSQTTGVHHFNVEQNPQLRARIMEKLMRLAGEAQRIRGKSKAMVTHRKFTREIGHPEG